MLIRQAISKSFKLAPDSLADAGIPASKTQFKYLKRSKCQFLSENVRKLKKIKEIISASLLRTKLGVTVVNENQFKLERRKKMRRHK
jgi:hypothetical protein